MKALVIEDEESLRLLFSSFLQRMGFITDEARNSTEAVDKMTVSDYDIVLSDIHMPGGDGKALYRLISCRSPDLLNRLIFITGNPGDKDTARFLSSITCPVLFKPFSLLTLKKTVQTVMQKKAARPTSPQCA